MLKVEALLEFLDLGRQGLRIAGVTLKDLDGDRTAIGDAEQAVDNLQRTLAAVAAITALGQWTAASFHVARRDIVEHQRAVGDVAFGQSDFDGGLTGEQPVQGGVEFVFIDLVQVED
jgi:hypothetical protein